MGRGKPPVTATPDQRKMLMAFVTCSINRTHVVAAIKQHAECVTVVIVYSAPKYIMWEAGFHHWGKDTSPL